MADALHFIYNYSESDHSSMKVGRPCIQINKEDILELRQLNFSWTKIASMLGVSRQTLYRRLEEFDISTDKFSELSQTDLDELVRDIKKEHPHCGEVLLQGLLIHKGIKVPREKLRIAIHHVDHANTIHRRSSTISRRIYTTPCPNSVWHVDGNHKMIRWRLVIHAGIDGYSRCVVFVKCSNNNCATTVLNTFLEGVSVFGMPTRVRTDHGGENTEIWKHMLTTSGKQSSVLTGSSVHNERVERMWRDITRCVSSPYISIFRQLESEGLLASDNEVDLFCLHFVFIPSINKSLADFQGSWNCHPLSSEGNHSPLQLYTEGFIAIENAPNLQSSSEESASASIDAEVESVEVPSNKFVPCNQLLMELQSSSRTESMDLGEQLYRDCIQKVAQHLQGVCNNGCRLI